MIETGLVYIHSTKPTKRFVGCGALIEGGLIATCRHVWREATRAAAGSSAEEPERVEIEYPRLREGGETVKTYAELVEACEDFVDPAPDLVLLEPAQIPNGVFPLQLAAQEKFETGPAYVHARLSRKDQQDRELWREAFPKGEIDGHLTNEGLRQFSGKRRRVPAGWRRC